jgi:hypothetical protein
LKSATTREQLARWDRKRKKKASNNLALMIRTKYGMGKPRSLGTGLNPLLALQIALATLYVAWSADSDEFESCAA